MSFSAQVKEEIEKLKLWDNNSRLKQDEQIRRICIRQEFLDYGFVNDPNKKYHLEINYKNISKAEQMQKMLEESNIKSKIISKGKNYIVYLKDGEEISNFLALIGANSAVLNFEETRVIKDTRNNINRIVNCENANMDKIINASVKQINAINYLIQKGEIEKLSDSLKEIALLRKNNPDVSLEELGKLLSEPIGKSGANHRLRKIVEIAENIKLEEKC